MRGDHEQAWQDVGQAYDSFPEYMLYYRARARLAQGKVLLEKAESNGRTDVSRRLSLLPRTSFTFHLWWKG